MAGTDAIKQIGFRTWSPEKFKKAQAQAQKKNYPWDTTDLPSPGRPQELALPASNIRPVPFNIAQVSVERKEPPPQQKTEPSPFPTAREVCSALKDLKKQIHICVAIDLRDRKTCGDLKLEGFKDAQKVAELINIILLKTGKPGEGQAPSREQILSTYISLLSQKDESLIYINPILTLANSIRLESKGEANALVSALEELGETIPRTSGQVKRTINSIKRRNSRLFKQVSKNKKQKAAARQARVVQNEREVKQQNAKNQAANAQNVVKKEAKLQEVQARVKAFHALRLQQKKANKEELNRTQRDMQKKLKAQARARKEARQAALNKVRKSLLQKQRNILKVSKEAQQAINLARQIARSVLAQRQRRLKEKALDPDSCFPNWLKY